MPSPDPSRRPLLVIPTYNERGGIEDLLNLVMSVHPTLEVLVVDDSSPDGTGEVVEELAAQHERIDVLHRHSKLGLGSAYVDGFLLGLERDFDLFLEMDADMSHDPADLPRLIGAAGSADLVIGSRYVTEGQVLGWSSARHLLSRCANTYARWLLSFPIKDSTSGFRCYRRELLEAIELKTVTSEGYAFQIDLAYRAWRLGFEVVEIPITFKERRAGQSKMSQDIIVEGVVSVTKWGLRDLAQRLLGRRDLS
ncbi:MAG: polyprenol monophosphomannose synthase [Actinomycetota bacterium]|nr:polyprenol monophosphomannose synthase [Actinomycetota bacterium]